MRFAKPEEIDSEVWRGDSGDREPPETVTFAGEEMPIEDAVSLAGEMLDRPEAFGMAKASRVRELARENEELRDMVKSLRSDVAALWEAASVEMSGGQKAVEVDGSAFVPSSLNVYDPTEEFE